ncbi:uncharacterized protein LOC117114718 [Anneissia japonica]|uniref:uncharacterized protein LOC117114718 n=1 Tax=Anneissia japonica TaxID=1529436 RepID=UPI0014257380|nr:uncharacterized protein LOC117114718 [Anneissia japonica]
MKNNPMLKINDVPTKTLRTPERRLSARVMKTSTNPHISLPTSDKYCQFHEMDRHSLLDCRSFKAVPIDERNDLIKRWNLCFRCCLGSHRARDCSTETKCEKCGSSKHISLLCINSQTEQAPANHGEEDKQKPQEVTSTCTAICGKYVSGRSCAKIVLAKVYLRHRPHDSTMVYVVLDDQSNASLVKSELADRFGPEIQPTNYSLSTCSKKNKLCKGRRIADLMIESKDRNIMKLPMLIECNSIPGRKSQHQISLHTTLTL